MMNDIQRFDIRTLRGEFEQAYDEAILSDDVRETIVNEFNNAATQMGFDPLDVIDETRKLDCTLEWNTYYNVLDDEEF